MRTRGGSSFAAALCAAAVVATALLAAAALMGGGVGAASHCPPGFLSCYDGECLRQAKFCDGHQDCRDASDEEDCDAPCRPPDYFRCHNGKCVSHLFVCDGEDECGDGSDERNCHEASKTTTAVVCNEDEFRCGDNLCVPIHWRCDGQNDCLDGSDETMGCTVQLECTEKELFLCDNHHCIPREWRCDGADDCLDNSDEQGCSFRAALSSQATERCPVERGLYPCADHMTCAELSELCNGIKDCPDGSDEGFACNTSKTNCNTFGCGHRCIPTPDGPLCVCPKGFNISREKYCKDIDECEEYGICSQKCKNTPGSYECVCDSWYTLLKDNKTCKVSGPDPLLVFSMKTEIRAMHLNSEVYFSVAKDQEHVAGVEYDGIHMYWTTVVQGEEAIIRSEEDGSNKKVLVSSGLSLPEDLAVDWLTKNIYFTDSEVKHIGICIESGKACTSLVNEEVDSPRAIALLTVKGIMFWTDWGNKPMVAQAGMDGSSPTAFVSTNIHWPSGLALDVPNDRLYWADAKLAIVESIKFDGTDRRIVLAGVVKHPYGLAIFEDNLYWSDFKTSEIQACNKFTGKNVRKIVHSRNNYFYGVHIYHPSLHPENMTNPCKDNPCTDLCLLAPDFNYACACPENKILNEDKHSCREIEKHEGLVIGSGNTIVEFTHKAFGKQEVTSTTLHSISKIGALAYNKIEDTLFISDIEKKQIHVFNMKTHQIKPLIVHEIGKIVGLDFDYLGDNLYWCDIERETVEVFSMATRQRKTLLRSYGQEIPVDIVLVPEDGIMFIARKKVLGSTPYHIDKMNMDGAGGLMHVLENNLNGPTISLAFDQQLRELIVADSGRGSIEACEMDGSNHYGLQSSSRSPISVTTLGNELFWTTAEHPHLHWSSKSEPFSKVKHAVLEMFTDNDPVVLVPLRGTITAPDNPCRKENGGCSDICLVSHRRTVCVCPDDLVLQPNNKTCSTPAHCGKNQFKCERENHCISALLRCNGHPDCASGEDEMDCPTPCLPNQFECTNGQCIFLEQHCDGNQQCTDGSDEFNCAPETCADDEFQCDSGECITKRWRCDFQKDCKDGSDEVGCYEDTCPPGKFRCKSGSCIPASWECDHEINCADASDEHEGCPPILCAPEDFTCNNKRCIDSSLKCNRQDDCGDTSDELDCPAVTGNEGPLSCTDDQFRCKKERDLCLPAAVRCNGSAECPKGEDEMGCDCSIDQFKCDISKCIDERWVCDGMIDCEDKSDEEPRLCGQRKNVTGPCFGYRCNSGECVDLTQVCDGNGQCSDHSDEGGQCMSACTHGNPCADICNPTPSGPLCSCHPGYSMRAESTMCEDDDECSQNICSQLCLNSPGSFTCSCAKGFELRLDRMSCKAEGDAVSVVYVTNGNELRMAPYSLKRIHILHQDTGVDILGLDSNIPNKALYWSTGNGAIFITSLADRVTRNVSNLGRPEKIAVDWITSNVYFSDDASSEEVWIKVCNFQEKKCAKLIKAEYRTQIDNLVIDPIAGYLFWTERNLDSVDQPHDVIKRAEASGSNPVVLVHDLSVVKGLAIDSVHRWLFWVDHKESLVGSVGYHGEGRHLVLDKQVKYVSGLQFFEDSLYWIETETGRLMKCRIFGQPKHCEWVELNSRNVNHFLLFQEQLQRTGENRCLEKKCSYLCVSGATEPQCICQDGTLSTDDDAPCQRTSHWQPIFPATQTDVESSSFPVVGAVVIIILIIIIGLAVYLFHKKFQFSPPDITTGVRYITSTYSAFRKGPIDASAPKKMEEEMEVVNSGAVKLPANQKSLTPESRRTLQFHISDLNSSDGEETDLPVRDTARLIP